MLVGLVVVAVPFVVLAAVVVVLVRRRTAFFRQRAYEAAQFGWFPAPPNPWLVQTAENLWQNGKAGQMLAGEFRGRGVCLLDYTYTTVRSNGQQTTSSTHQVHLVALNLPAALPPLTVTAESTLKRVFGGKDLELESKAFNDAFRIACADNRYASAVLHPRMMEWMLFNQGLEWQIAGNALVSWGIGPFTIPMTLARLEAMSGVIDRLPPFVLRDYGVPAY
ncbi:hypothetical protein Kfla_5704 [Kribbella flavida DSM 17836]|uniref:Uncharacterized protein n=1 Tax=Kribbella flavida (strain DSM 17836 / JCM 10339 / NBRC 14399) TaxID=479435 RepID=D2PPB3_KRIFD|nr:hypothetical protein Kfla_5704 [Kribbella flavida DSM 17836]